MDETTGAGFEVLLAAFGNLESKVNQTHTRLDSLENPKPILEGKRVFGVGTIGTSPTPVYPTSTLDGPAAGLVWNVRAVALTGITDAHTAVAGVTGVEFYCGQQELGSTAGQPVIANFPDLIPGATSATAPAAFTITRHLVWAHPHDMPYALVYGGSGGTQVFFLALVEEWNIDDVWKMSIGKR